MSGRRPRRAGRQPRHRRGSASSAGRYRTDRRTTRVNHAHHQDKFPTSMKYTSSRESAAPVTLGPAIAAGLVPDGGLYVPERMPQVSPDALDPDAPLAELAAAMLAPFFAGDPDRKSVG